MKTKRVLAVLSGGMDSTTALYWALDQGFDVVGAISFEYGSKHNDREYQAAEDICRLLKVPLSRSHLAFVAKNFKSDLLKTGGDIPNGHYADPSMKKTVVPFRNGIMLAIAAGYAESIGAEAVLLGNHFGDHAIYPDCRKTFSQAMAQAISEGTYANIELMTPFVDKDKADIAEIGAKLGVPFRLTYSCYNGRQNHCGRCGTCFERREAFNRARIEDPTEYEA